MSTSPSFKINARNLKLIIGCHRTLHKTPKVGFSLISSVLSTNNKQLCLIISEVEMVKTPFTFKLLKFIPLIICTITITKREEGKKFVKLIYILRLCPNSEPDN